MSAAVERASSTDRAFLAMDTPGEPEQFGVILTLGKADGLDLAGVRRLIADRVPAVPRLRQVLVRAPFGGGGPIWVDDSGFDVRGQVRATVCAAPGDEQALLDTGLAVVATPLPRDGPLWSAVLVTGLDGGGVALVIVLHHVLADGIGGLTVLSKLVDPGAVTAEAAFPSDRPSTARLVADAWSARLGAVRRSGRALRTLWASTSAAGGLRPPRAAPCSLIGPSGPGLRLAVVRADLAALRTAAHRRGASVNDAVLVAVAGALHRLLETRGQSVGTFVVTVPVSGRHANGDPALGNLVSPLLVAVPGTGDVIGRLERVAAEVRATKAAATGPPPIAVLGGPFRLLAALGGYRWYLRHQRRMHTLVSHVRGPDEPLTFGGVPIDSAIPVGTGDSGNMTVFFEALSYAGTLTISVLVKADRFPDLGVLLDGLRAELGLVLGMNPAGGKDP
ncbi:wax ester/triacylglycerol synthase domain-containing protein [Amycolatopsis sp. NPDC059657]|uniref:wax ester/triacylglycerol synthase domain-containing protein n=1 Tax=Amycolatopsis sp. NPDC059657 TaxID=3346899 RepID=UPI00366F0606